MSAELGSSLNPRDFVPGDPAAIREDASALTAVADRLDDAVARLSSIQADGWTGAAGDAFAERAHEHVKRWKLAAGAYRSGAQDIGTYADQLDGAQRQAQIAIDLYEAGESARIAWEAKPKKAAASSGQGRVSTSLVTDPGAGDREEARQLMLAAQRTAAAEAQVAQDKLAGRAKQLDGLNDTILSPLKTTTAATVSLSSGVAALLRRSSTTELLMLLYTQPELLTRLTPEEAAAWWQGLGGSFDAEGNYLPSLVQSSLILAAPAVIGNLNGLPYGARDQANRIWLEQQLAAARTAAEPYSSIPMRGPAPGAVEAETRLAALQNILDTLNTDAPGERFLIALTGDVPPLAQIAVGNLDTAQNVSYLIPGMNTFTTDMDGWTTAAQNLYNQLHDLNSTGSFAVVAWVGYETPPVPVMGGLDFGVMTGDYARAGADRLATDLAGFNAATSGHDATLNVVAHSYGTTTSATTLAENDLGITNYVMVGSAGIEPAVGGADAIYADHVYAAQADDSYPWVSGDPWAWQGRLGSGRDNPIEDAFGATVMGADGEPGNHELHATTAHDATSGTNGGDDAYGYLEADTESLRNVARALLGEPELITPDQAPVYDPNSPYLPGNPYSGFYTGRSMQQ
ncbi:putative T7SS-secreted protein [Agromyces soli]